MHAVNEAGESAECHQTLSSLVGSKNELPIYIKLIDSRVSYRGAGVIPETLKLNAVINVLSQVLNINLVPDCVRSNLRGSRFKIFLGEHATRPPY